MRFLVIEDDYASSKFLYAYLSNFGECDKVDNGMEALSIIAKALNNDNYYDLICIDIMLPKLNGVKVLKALRTFEMQKGFMQERRAKVIMTTALGEGELVKESFELGCDAYASKPIGIEKLNELLEFCGILQVGDTSVFKM